MTRARVELDASTRVEAVHWPSGAGARVSIVRGEERVQLDDPVNASDLRLLEKLLHRRSVDPLADPDPAAPPLQPDVRVKVRK